MPTSRRAEISQALRQRIINAVELRGLAAGARLPSARAMAKELKADPRVVAAAYRELTAEGVVQRFSGSRGFFVAEESAGTPVPTTEWLVDILAAGLARGIHAPDLPAHLRRAMEGNPLRAACVECNRDQQVWLCRELEEDYGIVGTPVELTSLESAEVLPVALQEADVVVTTPSHESVVREIAERMGKPLVVVTVRPDLIGRVNRLLAEGPVYFIGTDPRFRDKVRQRFGSAQFPDPACPMIVGFDDIGAIPAGAPAWVMRTAREALGGVPEQLQVLSTLRAFSPATQRAVLQFVVRANAALHSPRKRAETSASPGASQRDPAPAALLPTNPAALRS